MTINKIKDIIDDFMASNYAGDEDVIDTQALAAHLYGKLFEVKK